MTEIDPSAEIRISRDADRVTAMLPLDGPVTQEWHHRYDALAKAHDVRATIAEREKAWIVVSLSVPAERADIEATMDAARDLIAKIEADDQSAAQAEGIIRDWWARQRS